MYIYDIHIYILCVYNIYGEENVYRIYMEKRILK